MEVPAEPLARAVFTAAQFVAASRSGNITERQRLGRQSLPTYPIDNVPPEVASDRDDGIFVEAQTQQNGYRVHITIADVAGHISLSNPLARAAYERAFTIYRPPMTDPMFPKPLEDRLSLENGMERLGLTVSIDLDAQYQPEHTEFQRVITHAQSVDYLEAQIRMQSDPQFQLMKEIARGLRQHFFGSRESSIWQEMREARPLPVNISEDELAATKMVETYMLLANYAVARLFEKSGLPFLYRNFDDTPGKEGHAYYSTECTEHKELQRIGLKGPYCHFTSPIRRGPDFYNGHMVHFAIDFLSDLEMGLQQILQVNAASLHRALWHAATGLLAALPEKNEVAALDVLQTLGLEGSQLQWMKIKKLIAQLLERSLPIARGTLQSHADHINFLNQHERELAHAPEIRRTRVKLERFEERVRKLEQLTQAGIHGKSNDDFSMLLRDAAYTGILPQPLLVEALHRIGENHFERSKDAFHIMMVAQYPDDAPWLALKKAIATLIKTDPLTVNSVLEMAQAEGYLSPEAFVAAQVTLPITSQQHLPREKRSVRAALLALKDDAYGMIAAPYYSIGNDQRAALSHAKYSFLEHYAFGQLKPIDQSAIPNLLYAELNQTMLPKDTILEAMAHEIGAEFSIEQRLSRTGKSLVQLSVSGGRLMEPIGVTVTASSPERAMDRAARKLLSKPSFKDAVSFLSPLEMHKVAHPRSELERCVADAGLQMLVETQERRANGRSQFHSTVVLSGRDHLEQFDGTGPNTARSINMACIEALLAHGWLGNNESIGKARAWTTEIFQAPESGFFSS